LGGEGGGKKTFGSQKLDKDYYQTNLDERADKGFQIVEKTIGGEEGTQPERHKSSIKKREKRHCRER